MIHIARESMPPKISIYSEISPKFNNMSKAEFEREEAIRFFSDPKKFCGNKKLTKDSFSFKIYKDPDLARELELVFGKKCAYCDSGFAHVTPKDIEHFRPKSEVKLQTGSSLVPGYYWLAGDWENLLVSCPDCNRARKHTVSGQSEKVTLGKETQFPLSDEANRVRSHTAPISLEESCRLLLNPCIDQPEEHLTYDENGLILPKSEANGSESRRGKVSIDTYALQRKALVEERKKVLNEVLFDIESTRRALIEFNQLQQIPGTESIQSQKLDDIKRLRSHLKERFDPLAPYIGMIRDYVKRTKASGGFNDLIKNGVDPESLLK